MAFLYIWWLLPAIIFGSALLWFLIHRPRPLLFLALCTSSLAIYSFPALGGFNLRVSRMLLIIAFLAWVIPVVVRRGRRIRWSPAMGVFLIFYGYVLVLVFRSENLATAIPQLGTLTLGGLAILLIPQLIRGLQDLKLGVAAYLLSALPAIAFAGYTVSLWVQGGWRTRIPIPLGDVLHVAAEWREIYAFKTDLFPRFTYPFTSPSFLGPYMATTLLLAMCILLHRRRKLDLRLMIWLGYCLSSSVVLVGTLSRAAWVGLAAGLLTILLVHKRLVLKKRVWMMGGGALLVLVLLLWLVVPPGAVTDRFNPDTMAGSYAGHIRTRLKALELFAESPLWGIGWANFEYQTGWLHSHSIYTTVLAEGGIIGLTLLLCFLGTALFQARRAVARAPKESELFFMELGLFSAYVSLLVSSFLQQYYLTDFFWYVIGLAVASALLQVKGDDGSAPRLHADRLRGPSVQSAAKRSE